MQFHYSFVRSPRVNRLLYGFDELPELINFVFQYAERAFDVATQKKLTKA